MKRIYPVHKYQLEYADNVALTPDGLVSLMTEYTEQTDNEFEGINTDFSDDTSITEITKESFKAFYQWLLGVPEEDRARLCEVADAPFDTIICSIKSMLDANKSKSGDYVRFSAF